MNTPDKRSPAKGRPKKLNVGSASTHDEEADLHDYYDEKPPLVVPLRWVNTIIGFFLLPIAAIWTKTFFSIFSMETIHHSFWATEEFWFFALGIILWLITFFGLPRPLVIYVFGHELTHAIWVWMMGGKVSEFRVTRDGGHILTNKHNLWISLAPYFYPIYSVAVVILYGIAAMFWDVAPYTRWLFLALGITWAFHISFTLWMIPKGQSDLTYHGTFYSLVVIYLMNIILLTALGLVAAPQATFFGFGRELFYNTADFASTAARLIRLLLH